MLQKSPDGLRGSFFPIPTSLTLLTWVTQTDPSLPTPYRLAQSGWGQGQGDQLRKDSESFSGQHPG